MSEERAAIITGGTRGIGRGLVTSFHNAGYRVLACARSEPDASASKSHADGVSGGA